MRWIVSLFLILGVIGYWNRSPAPAPRPSTPVARSAQASTAAGVTAQVFGNSWRVTTSASQVDDSKSVHLTLVADNQVAGKYGGAGDAVMTARCVENTTAVTLRFADHFMAGLQSYGKVTYRLDQDAAKTKNFQESTSNEVLGLWNGGSAIPFLKGMFGKKSMVVRATPFNENPIEVRYNVEGLETAIAPLREACHW